MSLPPTARPPGRRLSPQAALDVALVRRVQRSLGTKPLKKQQEKPKKPRSVAHLGPFRDGYEVLREANGKFAKDTTPPHRRRVKKPPFSGPRPRKVTASE